MRSLERRRCAVLLTLGLLAALGGPAAPSAAQSVDVVELSVDDVREGYRTGAFSAVELTQAFLDRIAQYEGRYNAFVSMNPAALETAAALDLEYARSGPRSPLHGVPVVIKDNMDFGGLVTTVGWEGFSAATGGTDLVPDEDATVVARLREAGAIILGKTNLPDFALDGTRTRSSVAGVTLNPYNVSKAPGGSSGGTATAVNASFAVLGLGTETGGSIQTPASAQALVGLKPTYGLVPLDGVFPLAATYIDVVGPLAKTVRDAAIILDVIAGPTEADPATFAAIGHEPGSGYAAGLDSADIVGRRFGLLGGGWRTDGLPLDPRTERVYREAVAALEAVGAVVVEDPFRGSGFAEVYAARPRVQTRAYDTMLYLRRLGDGAAARTIDAWERLTGRPFPGGLGTREDGTPPVPPVRPSATEGGDAYQAWRLQLRAMFRRVMEEHDLDALFFPQAASPGRDLVEDPTRPDYSPNNWPEIPSNIVNDLGVPVVTVPYAYYEDGVPFVVAFIGDLWTEGKLLGYAYVFETTTRARRPPSLFEEVGS